MEFGSPADGIKHEQCVNQKIPATVTEFTDRTPTSNRRPSSFRLLLNDNLIEQEVVDVLIIDDDEFSV